MTAIATCDPGSTCLRSPSTHPSQPRSDRPLRDRPFPRPSPVGAGRRRTGECCPVRAVPRAGSGDPHAMTWAGLWRGQYVNGSSRPRAFGPVVGTSANSIDRVLPHLSGDRRGRAHAGAPPYADGTPKPWIVISLALVAQQLLHRF